MRNLFHESASGDRLDVIVASIAGASHRLYVCARACVSNRSACTNCCLNDSDDVVDLFILHLWNPKHLTICPHIFYSTERPPPRADRGALGLCLPRLRLLPAQRGADGYSSFASAKVFSLRSFPVSTITLTYQPPILCQPNSNSVHVKHLHYHRQ